MEIISSSIDDGTIKKLEFIEENSAFNGRSELIRKAVSGLYEETKRKNGLKGNITAAVFVQHSHESEQKVSEISHSTEDIVLTQLHNRLDEEKCLEIFLVQGNSERVLSFYNDLNGVKATDSVKLIPQT